MKKYEREQLEREQTSSKLVREVSSQFQKEVDQDIIIKCINPVQHDWSTLERSRYPMTIIHDAEWPHICFRRSQEIQEPQWTQNLMMHVWRPY